MVTYLFAGGALLLEDCSQQYFTGEWRKRNANHLYAI